MIEKNIKKVETKDDYILEITFEDNRIVYLDMKPYLNKPMYVSLKDKETFKKVEPFYDTVVWSNGVDIAPELIIQKAI